MTQHEQEEPVDYMVIFPAQFNRGDSRLFYLSRNIESVNKIWVNSQVLLSYGWSMRTEGRGRLEQGDGIPGFLGEKQSLGSSS